MRSDNFFVFFLFRMYVHPTKRIRSPSQDFYFRFRLVLPLFRPRWRRQLDDGSHPTYFVVVDIL